MLKPITLQTKQISKLSSSWWERKRWSQAACSQPTADNRCKRRGRWTGVLTRALARGAATAWAAFTLPTVLLPGFSCHSYSHGWHPSAAGKFCQNIKVEGAGYGSERESLLPEIISGNKVEVTLKVSFTDKRQMQSRNPKYY